MSKRQRENEENELPSKKKKTISFCNTVGVNVFERLIRESHEINKNPCLKLIDSFIKNNPSLGFSSFKYYNLLVSFFGVENIKIANNAEQFIINEILYDREMMIEKLKFLVAQETYYKDQIRIVKIECANIIRHILLTDNNDVFRSFVNLLFEFDCDVNIDTDIYISHVEKNTWKFVNLLFEFYHDDIINVHISDVGKNVIINQIVYNNTMLIKKIIFLKERKESIERKEREERQATFIKMECSNIIRNILLTDKNIFHFVNFLFKFNYVDNIDIYISHINKNTWKFVNLLFEFYHDDDINICISDIGKNIIINQIVYDNTMLIKKIIFLKNLKEREERKTL